jgi:hypothetical protein
MQVLELTGPFLERNLPHVDILAGLFDWSMKYQDGTKPSQWDPDEYDPQKMKWCVEMRKELS